MEVLLCFSFQSEVCLSISNQVLSAFFTFICPSLFAKVINVQDVILFPVTNNVEQDR